MSERTSYPPGSFCWVDIAAHDLGALATFYKSLFGWECDEQPATHEGGSPYWQCSLNGAAVAGVGQMSDEMIEGGIRPSWNSYVSVTDVQATANRVTELGRSVVWPSHTNWRDGHGRSREQAALAQRLGASNNTSAKNGTLIDPPSDDRRPLRRYRQPAAGLRRMAHHEAGLRR
jgi:predicted enzyme related to lactoylglutathione lyase